MAQMKIRRIDARGQSPQAAVGELLGRLTIRGDIQSPESRRRTEQAFGKPLSPQQVVETICREVRTRGLEAVLEFTRRIDAVELTAETIRVSQQELAQAHAQADPQFLQVVRQVRENILRFQQAVVPRDVRIPLPQGRGWLMQRFVPVRRVGVCVPGGAAAYPSTVLMTVVPAQAAGVRQIAVVAPPTPHGAYNPLLLATCWELGVEEVYRLGGAQAVAALAYGVEGLPRVDMIVGPGNLFVTLAKKHVFGEVGIDALAGPSEVVVLADASAQADWTAADLLAQAEHAPGASFLITWHEPLVEQVYRQLELQLQRLARADLTRESLEQFGALILVQDPQQAVELVNFIAPEHLHIATRNAEELLDKIDSAGAVFLGHWSPVPLGDYVAGPSHVLPTGTTARFASGLSAAQFVRSHSVICYDAEGLQHAAGAVELLARTEGLPAHWNAVECRLQASC